MEPVCMLLSEADKISLITFRRAVVVEKWGRKPDWWGNNKLWSLRYTDQSVLPFPILISSPPPNLFFLSASLCLSLSLLILSIFSWNFPVHFSSYFHYLSLEPLPPPCYPSNTAIKKTYLKQANAVSLTHNALVLACPVGFMQFGLGPSIAAIGTFYTE